MSSSARNQTPSPVTKCKGDKLQDNVRRGIQRYLAACAFEGFKTKTLSEKLQFKEIQKRYHGKGDMVGHVWKFLNRSTPYYRAISHEDETISNAYIIDPSYSRAFGSKLVLKENVTSELLEQMYISKKGLLTGRTLLKMAKTEEKEAKKILSQMGAAVKSGIVQKNSDGEYEYCSGQTEKDLDEFLIYRMYNWEKIYILSVDDTNDDNASMAAAVTAVITADINNQNSNEDDGSDELLSECPYVDVTNLDTAPESELPIGWFLFKSRGPMADIGYRYDFLSKMEKVGKNAGRAHYRKEDEKEKNAERDLDIGMGKGDRGLSLGASAQGLAVVAQSKRKMCHMQHSTKIVQLDATMISKNDRLKSMIEAMKMFNTIGMDQKATEMADQIQPLMEELKELEDEMKNLKEDVSAFADTDAPIDTFLERGAKAMGVTKKTKTNEEIESKNDSEVE